jgi:hypothetical protein
MPENSVVFILAAFNSPRHPYPCMSGCVFYLHDVRSYGIFIVGAEIQTENDSWMLLAGTGVQH